MTRRILAFFSLCLLNIPLTAQAIRGMDMYEINGSWFMSAGAGRSFYLMDKDNYINPGINWPADHYYKNSIHDGSFVDATLGYAWTQTNCEWLPAVWVGVNYTYAFAGKVSGFINQYNLGEFKNYSYSYDFSRQTLLAIGKVDIIRFEGGFMPYVIAGVGGSWNKGGSYREEPLGGVTPRISPGYNTAKHASWGSWIIGAGLDYAIREDVWVSLEYNYGSFGTVETGNGDVVPSLTGQDYSGQHLSNTLKANSVALNFTYLINCI